MTVFSDQGAGTRTHTFVFKRISLFNTGSNVFNRRCQYHYYWRGKKKEGWKKGAAGIIARSCLFRTRGISTHGYVRGDKVHAGYFLRFLGVLGPSPGICLALKVKWKEVSQWKGQMHYGDKRIGYSPCDLRLRNPHEQPELQDTQPRRDSIMGRWLKQEVRFEKFCRLSSIWEGAPR